MKISINIKRLIVLFFLVIIAGLLGFLLPKDVQKETSPEWITNTYFYKYQGTIVTTVEKRPLPDVDPKTFTTLGFLIGKDKNHVYIADKIQPNYDAGTFEKYGYLPRMDFFRDKNGIYYLISDELKSSPIDPKQVTQIGNYIKASDGIYLISYSGISKIEGIDAPSFRELGLCASVEMSSGKYMADKNHVYVGDSILDGVDPNKFKKIADIIPGADGEMPYHLTIWTDEKNVYVSCGILVKEADLNTFKYLGDNKGEDKNYTYSFNTGNGYTAERK